VTRLIALAPAKLNLCLFVGAPRVDGLHPLVSIVQPLSLADELTLEPAAADEVVCAGVEGENLAARALAAYRATGWDGPPVRVTIGKRIPIAAGLGGGSADAAAALRLAAHAAGRPGDPRLAAVAPGLGADVPAQIEPRRALMTGAGERVEPLPEPQPFGVLILPSEERLETAAVYAEADRLGLPRSAEELADLARAIRAGDPMPTHNDLEPAAQSLCPSIDAALADARGAGATRALVAGSGPTVVGLFESVTAAHEAATALRARHRHAIAAEPVAAGYGAPEEVA
jgi:4-diphosphocytidyl-2-C-methyl-D-erythritol kinase